MPAGLLRFCSLGGSRTAGAAGDGLVHFPFYFNFLDVWARVRLLRSQRRWWDISLFEAERSSTGNERAVGRPSVAGRALILAAGGAGELANGAFGPGKAALGRVFGAGPICIRVSETRQTSDFRAPVGVGLNAREPFIACWFAGRVHDVL